MPFWIGEGFILSWCSARQFSNSQLAVSITSELKLGIRYFLNPSLPPSLIITSSPPPHNSSFRKEMKITANKKWKKYFWLFTKLNFKYKELTLFWKLIKDDIFSNKISSRLTQNGSVIFLVKHQNNSRIVKNHSKTANSKNLQNRL